jgi:hypothetical protein
MLSLGLQQSTSMPLLGYFTTIGGVLTALLLLLNFILEPRKPETSMQATTAVETSLRKPRTTTGFMESTISMTAKAPAPEARREPEIAANLAQLARQPSSRDKTVRKSFTTTKHKSGRKATSAGRAYRDAAYSSYAQRPPKRQSFDAEGTLGPH